MKQLVKKRPEMKRLAASVLLAAVMLGGSVSAQTTADPTLHKRGDALATKPSPNGQRAGYSTLPDDASGEYVLDESGSVVQITLEKGRLSWYVSKMGDDHVPMTFFFDQSRSDGNGISFTTKKLHGYWYSFEGEITRGDPQIKKAEDGYYRLRGGWMVHNDIQQTQESTRVSLKSTPRSD
jgi:hypothetical protein